MVPMSKFMDENYSGNFIDEIDDLIGLPPDINECGGGNMFGSGNYSVNTPTDDLPPVSDPLFSGSHGNVEFDFFPELFVQYDDIVQPGWFSAFVEESFSSGGMCLGMDNTLISNPSSQNQFHASSPNSVLESNNSRARNKRPRTPTLCIQQTVQLNPHSFSSEDNPPKAKNFVELPSMEKLSKKTKVKTAFGRDPVKSHQEKCPVQEERKCKHCGITKTPQWRLGPMGPKTLCNACGVRHKSGRLFPEYRPAASPTFVPSLHSNSHKKVLEMRSKSELLVPTLSP